MDSKKFEELVERLTSAATRRNAVKGVLGGALASVGVTSVAAKKGGQGKRKGPKEGKGGKGGKKGGKGGKKGGQGKGNKHGHTKVAVCHKGRETIFVPEPAVQAHLNHGDTLGACPYDPE